MIDDALDVAIMVNYVDHDDWPSAIGIADATNWQAIYGSNIAGIAIDNNDGTMTGQVTVYRAGVYVINTLVNSIYIIDSPMSPLLVRPTYLYAPYCVTLGIPELMVAGTDYSFKIQGRDFYQNNIREVLTDAVGSDYSVTYSLLAEETDIDFLPVTVDAVVTDDTDLGNFLIEMTLTKAGRYSLTVLMKGLEVPTLLDEVVVVPVTGLSATTALTSNFTGVAADPYTTGQEIVLTIWARDVYENHRTESTTDVF